MIPDYLRQYFWDVDARKIDLERNRRYVIERVAEMGDERACIWLRRHYSDMQIRRALHGNRRVKARVLNFWNLLLGK